MVPRHEPQSLSFDHTVGPDKAGIAHHSPQSAVVIKRTVPPVPGTWSAGQAPRAEDTVRRLGAPSVSVLLTAYGSSRVYSPRSLRTCHIG